MSTPRKLGVLVAIPIKGRRLLNKSRGKQSPYVQLKLSDQKKRTKASLIASVEPEWDQEARNTSVRLEVYQGNLDMHVTVYDEGKKNELIGEGILRLHEVIDKGELDVWFMIKNKGSPAGDIYFELTFYAVAPPPVVGAPVLRTQIQHPPIRYIQPGYMPAGRPLPHTPYVTMHGNTPGPPVPFPGNTYQHPTGYNNSNNQRLYPIPQGHSYQSPQPQPPTTTPSSYRTPNRTPPLNTTFTTPPPFQPKTRYNPKPKMQVTIPGRYPNNISQSNFSPQGNVPTRFHGSQPQPGMHNQAMRIPVSHPSGHNMSYGQTFNATPNKFPNNSHHDRRLPGSHVPIVTPPVQYNYTLGSFP
ncbi:hypothetical protein BGX27_004715 [Mortierella sp. AM989]|nr:hypothetical protein BGX27_004715 [Mortierella sp. AM989]